MNSILLLLLAVSMPVAAIGGSPGRPQPASPPPWHPGLAHAAADTLLRPWQREFMQQIGHQGPGEAFRSRPGFSGATSAAEGIWEELTPGARVYASAILDPLHDRMIVFGGDDYTGLHFNDTWALSLSNAPTWSRLEPFGDPPSPRTEHTAIYDPVHDRMIVFGGQKYLYDGTPQYFNEAWALSLSGAPGWTAMTPGGPQPSARWGHTAIYDPVRQRMLVFGGYDGSHRNDVWALSLTDPPAWTALTPSGTPPGARFSHSAVYDPFQDRMIVFGGYASSGATNDDTWALSLSGATAWAALTPSGPPPPPRGNQSAIYDPVGRRMVMVGGRDGEGLGDVWALSLWGTPAWYALAPTGDAPGPGDSRAAIYDPLRSNIVEFGGYDRWNREVDDIWLLALSADNVHAVWTGLEAPQARALLSAIFDPLRDRMIVFAGSTIAGDTLPTFALSNDAWAIPLTGEHRWTRLTTYGPPPSPRRSQSVIWDPLRDQMVVFGGQSDGGALNDIWTLPLGAFPWWALLTPAGTPPSPRTGHSAIYDPLRDRMIVFGGSFRNDVWALSLETPPTWTALAPTGTPPSRRQEHSAIYDPLRDRMIVFGGYYGSVRSNDVWELSLSGTPAWTELTPSGTPPAPRAGHSAIYDPLRDRMVVFGGQGPGLAAPVDTVWALGLGGSPEWKPWIPTGRPPNPRQGHGAIYDPERQSMVLFGGADLARSWFAEDLWSLSVADDPVGVHDDHGRAIESALMPALPNPFRGSTTARYTLARSGRVHLGVYDLSGRLVRRLVEGERPAGAAEASWDGASEAGSRVGAGMYLIRLSGPGVSLTCKVILLD